MSESNVLNKYNIVKWRFFKVSAIFLFSVLVPASHAIESASVSIMDASSIWRLSLSLLLLVLIIPALLWGLKRLQRVQHKFSRSKIQVVESQAVGAKERVLIVEVEGKRLLLGVTSQQISVLTDLKPYSGGFADELQKASAATNAVVTRVSQDLHASQDDAVAPAPGKS